MGWRLVSAQPLPPALFHFIFAGIDETAVSWGSGQRDNLSMSCGPGILALCAELLMSAHGDGLV